MTRDQFLNMLLEASHITPRTVNSHHTSLSFFDIFASHLKSFELWTKICDRKLSKVDVKSMSFEEFIEIERTIDVGENDLVPVSIQDDEVSYAF